mgnify:FL=1
MITKVIAYIVVSLFFLGIITGYKEKVRLVNVIMSILWPVLLILAFGKHIFYKGADINEEVKKEHENANEKG